MKKGKRSSAWLMSFVMIGTLAFGVPNGVMASESILSETAQDAEGQSQDPAAAEPQNDQTADEQEQVQDPVTDEETQADETQNPAAENEELPESAADLSAGESAPAEETETNGTESTETDGVEAISLEEEIMPVAELPEGTYPVYFDLVQEGAAVAVYTLSEKEGQGDMIEPYAGAVEATEGTDVTYCLEPGNYIYTAKLDGYYASTCSFHVDNNGTVGFQPTFVTGSSKWGPDFLKEQGLDQMLDAGISEFHLDLEKFPQAENGKWDGKTLDVSWYEKEKNVYEISTPAQLAGLAAIVNGIYNDEITTIIDNGKTYTPEDYEKLNDKKIVKHVGYQASDGGQNVKSTSFYYYGADEFDGKTVKLTEDIDMGAAGVRYMPIGGRYQMQYVTGTEKNISDGCSSVRSYFDGTFDGQGHMVTLWCNRYVKGNSFGDSQAIGMIGNLGGGEDHPVNPTVRNVAVDGYVYGRRAVGGIVGNTGWTSASEDSDGSVGIIIENCLNFADVTGTDKQGTGGIAGSSKTLGVLRNCANFGHIKNTNTGGAVTGGIVGENQLALTNCYNIGYVENPVTGSGTCKSRAIGQSDSENQVYLKNLYYLQGSGMEEGGYFNGSYDKTQVIEIASKEGMQGEDFVAKINNGYRKWKVAAEGSVGEKYLRDHGQSTQYPVPLIFAETQPATVTKIVDESGIEEAIEILVGELFDTTKMNFVLYYSDGTKGKTDDYTFKVDGEEQNIRTYTFKADDHEITFEIQEGDQKGEFTYQVNVTNQKIEKIAPAAALYETNYCEGDPFEFKGTYNTTSWSLTIYFDNKTCVYVRYDPTRDAFVGTDVYTSNDKNTGKTGSVLRQDGRIYDLQFTLGGIPVRQGTPVTMQMQDQKMYVQCTFNGETSDANATKKMQVVSSVGEPEQDENGTYLVSTTQDLAWLANASTKGRKTTFDARLMADITATDVCSIGASGYEYCGTFDGNGHTVYMDNATKSLIDRAANATIKNLVVSGSIITSNSLYYAGGIVGQSAGTECYLTFENCGNETNITAKPTGTSLTSTSRYAGGLIGNVNNNDHVTIKSCYNKGSIISERNAAGGLVGYQSENSVVKIEDSYNTGSVTGSKAYGAGGIIGGIDAKSGDTTITNVYNSGTVAGTQTNIYGNAGIGAVIGLVNANTVEMKNVLWMDGVAESAVGETEAVISGEKRVSAEVLNTSANALNKDEFKANQTTCYAYPVLAWEPAAVHTWGAWDITDATCTTAGQMTRTCDACSTTETKTLAALGHDYTVTFTWSEDYKSATANFNCSRNDSDMQGIEAEVAVTSAADCEKESWGTYTATATGPDGKTYSEDQAALIPAIGHDYGEPTFDWAEDGSSVRVLIICNHNEDHTASVTKYLKDGDIKKGTEKVPTCTEPGTIPYTVEVELDGVDCSDTKQVVTKSALGHTYQEPAITWAADGKSATVTWHCDRDSHDEKVEATVDNGMITTAVSKNATCSAKGTTTYTAAVTVPANGKAASGAPTTFTDTKNVEDIPATGNHNYVNGVCTVCGAKEPTGSGSGSGSGNQTGNTGSQTGNTGSQTGNTGSQTGNTGSQTGNTGSQTGNTGSTGGSSSGKTGSTSSGKTTSTGSSSSGKTTSTSTGKTSSSSSNKASSTSTAGNTGSTAAGTVNTASQTASAQTQTAAEGQNNVAAEVNDAAPIAETDLTENAVDTEERMVEDEEVPMDKMGIGYESDQNTVSPYIFLIIIIAAAFAVYLISMMMIRKKQAQDTDE